MPANGLIADTIQIHWYGENEERKLPTDSAEDPKKVHDPFPENAFPRTARMKRYYSKTVNQV